MAHAVAEPVGDISIRTPRIAVNPWVILVVLMIGEFMILLDTTIMEVAIPNLISDLHASLDQALWVLNAYLLIYAALLITCGRLGDILGPKRLFMVGMAIFTAASAACLVSPNAELLIVFRVIQGVGAALLTPQPGTIITVIFPPERRGAAFGIMGAVIGLAAVTGPSLGGVLTSAFSWRAIFFPNIPVGIAAFLLAGLLVPELHSERDERLDIPGVVLATIGLVTGIFGVLEGEKYDWGTISQVGAFTIGPIHAGLVSIPLILLLSVLFLVAFIVWEMRTEQPLLPLSLFRDRNFSIGNMALVMVTFGLVGQMVVLLLFLQSVRGMTPLEAGIAVVPNALMVMAGAPLGGKLAEKINGKYLLFFGLLLYAAGLYGITRVASLNATGLSFTIPLLMTGFGMGLTIAPMASMALEYVAPSAAGAASGFMNTVRQVGAALGAAVIGAILQARLFTELHAQAVQVAPQIFTYYVKESRAEFIQSFSHTSGQGLDVGPGLTGATTIPPIVPPAVAHVLQGFATIVFQHAYLNAMKPTLYVPMATAVAIGCATLLMRSSRAAVAPAAAPEVPVAGEAAVPPAAELALPVPFSDTVILSFPQHGRRRPGSVRPLRTPYLEAIGGGAKSDVTLKPLFSLGRSGDVDLPINDPLISRKHAEIMMANGQILIRDLGSANGTIVNGHRIEGDQRLRDGDTIVLGDTTFLVHNDYEVARPRLVSLTSTGRREYLFNVGEPVTIGRLPSSQVVIQDVKASRKHAVVRVRDGQVVLRDLASLNGTWVNEDLVHGEQALRAGDKITIGDTVFIYQNDAEAAAA